MKIKLLLILIFLTHFAQAQKGTVNGTISDKDAKNAPLPFANVVVKGTTNSVTTDEKGKYQLKVEPGTYTLVFSFVGYETIEEKVTLKAGETITINKTLGSGSYKLEDVVITTSRRKNTESAVLLETKKAKQVISAISAEQMSKGTDGNAAQAIQRVPGVTINDGKFVMVRGLSERYNNVLINGALAPSTEVDRRTFSFDLLPVSTLEKMTIGKSGAAYLPGDFSGGLISVTTTENFSDFTQVSSSLGFRGNTTLEDYWQTEGSATDILGMDDGFRQLPSGFPTNRDVLNINSQSVRYANQLPNNFNPERGTAFFNTGISFSLGRKIKLKDESKNLRTINMISYSNSFQNYNKSVNTFINDFTGQTNTPQQQRDFDDRYYSNEVRLSVLSNWFYRYNAKNKITFKNLFNQIGENFTTLRSGFDFDQRPGQLLNNYEFGYSGRRILTSQFNGEHKINDRNTVQWVLGGNLIKDILPDLRRFRTFRNLNSTTENFTMIDPPSSNPFDTGRFYSELNETSVNAGVDYDLKIENKSSKSEASTILLKTGFFGDYKSRDFSARYFSYLIPGNVSQERKEELINLPLTEIFSPANVTATNGWVLREGSNQSDSYKANNLLAAGYVYGEFPIQKFLITGGVRVEHNRLEVDGFQGITPLLVQQPITSVLPSFNVSYTLNDKNLMRVAYSRTVNRPEFREIAPFLFYDFQEDTEVDGNSSLTTATIDNFDLRYEFYPTKGETASLGVFYKRFDNPIEFILPVVSQQRRMRYSNSDSAMLYGAELEVRKSFKEVFKNGFLSDLSINLNASYIFSEVDLGNRALAQDRKRALQGQSPYVINAALGYDNKENGWSGNLIYNRFGDRIYAVGGEIFPTIYEIARNQMDFTIAKTFKKTTYKLGLSNILNEKFQFFQDSNVDNKINNSDDPVFVHRTGVLYTFNVTYKF